ncbi:MAG: nucleotide pyrophosphohydrolase [Anaerolineae bacterium]
MDEATSIGALRRAIHDFQQARDWCRSQNPKSVSMSIAIEAAELMEHFQWLGPEESDAYVRDPALRQEVAAELADVLIYCLCFANRAGIDVSEAIQAKLAVNATRWPLPMALPGFDDKPG